MKPMKLYNLLRKCRARKETIRMLRWYRGKQIGEGERDGL